MSTYARSARDITSNLDTSILDGLEPAQMRLLAVLMARASEQGYRRGVQQGATMSSQVGRLRADLHGWRYTHGTDASPYADSRHVDTSLERLHAENAGLRAAGFPQEVRGAGKLDMDEAVERLRALAAVKEGARSGPDAAYMLADAAIFAFGLELMTVGGLAALGDVYDELVERHGLMAAAGVESGWTGVGGWSA